MKTSLHNLSRAARLLAVAAAALVTSHSAQAADGTWTLISSGNASGAWLDATTTNWAGDIVADGSAFTARFDTLDITAASTVALGAPRTIGTIIFGDTAPATGASWTLSNNSTPANILTLGGAATITVDAMSSVSNTGSNVTISAIIDGVNGLTKNGTGTNTTVTNNTAGTGTLTLSGANTYTGATNIDTGTIRATNALAFGGVAGGKLTTNVVTVASGARLLLGGVNIANTVNLNGANAISVSGGNSTLSGIVNLQSNSTAYVHNGGNYTLTFSGTLNLGSNVLTLQPPSTNNGIIIGGTLTGGVASGVTKAGNGPLTMQADGSGYSGTTTLFAGEIRIDTDTALGTGTFAIAPSNDGSVTVRSNSASARTIAPAVTLPQAVNYGNASGRLIFGSATTGNLTFTSTTPIALGSATRKFEVYNRTQFDAGFTGTSGITQQTVTGTLVLNGANTYTGTTTVNAGTMLVSGTHTAGAGTYVIGAAGTLGGNGSITATSLTTTAGSKLTPGETGVLGNAFTFALASGMNISASSNDTGAYIFDLATVGTSDKITLTLGTLDIGTLDFADFAFNAMGGFGAGTYVLFDASSAITGSIGTAAGMIGGFSSTLSIDNLNNDVLLTVVPEPSTWALLAFSLTTVLVFRRRRA